MGRRYHKIRPDTYRGVQDTAYILKAVREGHTHKAIAVALGTTLRRVEGLVRIAMQEVNTRQPYDPSLQVVTPQPEDIEQVGDALGRKVYALRRRAKSFDQIAQLLNITPELVRKILREQMRSYRHYADTEAVYLRDIQVQQLDAMMAAIMTEATGVSDDGEECPVSLEAIDRMVKLMDRKSKLLGLDAPQVVDINHRLEILAIQFNYDPDELKEIGRDVVSRYVSAKAMKAGENS